MTNTSMAGVGMYGFIIASLLRMLGVEVEQTEVDNFLLAGLTVVTFLMWVWGQLRRTDLTAGLFRK